jgi:hypothetical protein
MKNTKMSISVTLMLAFCFVTASNANGKLPRHKNSSVRSSVRVVNRSRFRGDSSLRAKRFGNHNRQPNVESVQEVANTSNNRTVRSVVFSPCKTREPTVGWTFDDTEICNRIDTLIDAQNSTKTAIDNLKQDLTSKIGEMVASNKATQDLIQQQIKQNNQLLFETLQKRLNSVPADLLTNQAFKDELEKLKKDILDEVSKRIQNHE